MAETTAIQWCDATFNPWRGCTKVAPECAHCYADKLSKRNPSALGTWGPNGTRVVAAESYWRQPLKWNRDAERDGVRKRVFCASLADVFEEWDGPMLRGTDVDGVPFQLHHFEGGWRTARVTANFSADGPVTISDVRRRLFSLIDATPRLDWLLLTKRPENIRRMWPGKGRSNVWLGTSAGTQETADEKIPELLKCRDLSPVLFVSCEPMLGPVCLQPRIKDCEFENHQGINLDWIICGGESGPGARPMHPDWARSLRDQCQAAGVPFFFKQWGDWLPFSQSGLPAFSQYVPNWPDAIRDEMKRERWADGKPCRYLPGGGLDLTIRVGKKAAGRLLDGREWNEFPTVAEFAR